MSDKTTTTVIGADTTIKGEMTFDGVARILGTVEGKIVAKGELQVASGASCIAEIEAGTITVDGNVSGNVTAHDRLELNAKASIRGDVVASRLIVAEGATFEGHCRVGTANGKAGAARPTLTEAKPAQPKAEPVAAKR
jgi:cytoskeletal protein CcmA (bactofilin family)